QDGPAVGRHVEDTLALRARGLAVPFTVVRLADETVIGATRFHQLDYWSHPGRPGREHRTGPDTCEIGYTWLAREALRTGANTEMKRLMLTHAFEVWRGRSGGPRPHARDARAPDTAGRRRRGLHAGPAPPPRPPHP